MTRRWSDFDLPGDDRSEDGATRYGFDWGPVVVERVAHVEGRGYCVSIRGRKDYSGQEVQVYVSEKGRVVTAYPIRGAKAIERSHP